jgi:hypothetical protein
MLELEAARTAQFSGAATGLVEDVRVTLLLRLLRLLRLRVHDALTHDAPPRARARARVCVTPQASTAASTARKKRGKRYSGGAFAVDEHSFDFFIRYASCLRGMATTVWAPLPKLRAGCLCTR